MNRPGRTDRRLWLMLAVAALASIAWLALTFALVAAILVALVVFWIVKDAPARIAATILQAEAIPSSW